MSTHPTPSVTDLFSLDGQVAIVTGGTGVLGGAMARGLARGREGRRAGPPPRAGRGRRGGDREGTLLPSQVFGQRSLAE